MDGNTNERQIETHPWRPFIPEGAKALILGTFPPGRHRWAMEFFYPNPTNDFWRIMGLLYYDDKNRFYSPETRSYDLDEIKSMLTRAGIAMGDSAYRVCRLRGNASDKYLEVVEPANIVGIIDKMPECRSIATTGEKAADIVASLTGIEAPKMGHSANVVLPSGRIVAVWRLPSTSRAYPMPLQTKAEPYGRFLKSAGCL